MRVARNAALLDKVRALEALVDDLTADKERLAAQLGAEVDKNEELAAELSVAQAFAFKTHVDLLARLRRVDRPVSPLEETTIIKKFFGKAQFAHRKALAEEKEEELPEPATQPALDFGVESAESAKSFGQVRWHHVKRLAVDRASAWEAKCVQKEAKKAGVCGANAGRRAKALRVAALAEGCFVPLFARGGVRRKGSKVNKAQHKDNNRHNFKGQLVNLGAFQ
jgi:hypothetical protein